MDHLIRIELRCQDDARRASERLPIVVVGSGSSSISSGSSTCSRPSSKLKELNRNNNNIIKFHHEQESKMNCRQNKTSKSHTQLVQQQQQHQSASNSVGRSREKNNRPKSSNSHNNRSPTPTITVANGVGVLPVSSSLQLQHGPSSHSTISINGHQSHTFGSHRSTATDSSGFSSGASTTSCCGGQSQTMSLLLSPSDYHHHHQRTSMPNEQQQQQPESRTNLIRSRLIEDLNRLEKIAAAALARKAQPDLQANTLSISPDDDNSRAPLSIDHPTMVNGVVQMSSAANTLSRGEFDYSTLCRDEFSSFIDYKARGAGFEGANHQAANTFVRKSSERDTQTGTRLKSGSRRHNRNGGVSKKRNQPGGPMLVGVHECERPRDTDCILSPGCSFASSSSSPADSERNLVFGGQSSPPCSEANSFATKDEDSSSSDSSYGDKHDNRHELTESGREEETLSSSHGEEVHVEENFSDDDNNSVTSSDGPPVESSRPKMNPREHEKLSGMLDVYLSRVESLLKLANGDKSVSLEELIEGCLNNGRCDDSSELIVRDEFKTTIAYVPRSDLPKFTKPRVIQEIEMLVETSEQDDTEDDDEDDHDKVKEGKETEKITTNLGTNYEALLSSPQTSAMLNWWPKQLSVTETELFSDLLNRPATTTSDDENNNQHFKKHAFIDQHQLRLLERSFFSRWLESEGGEPGNEKAYFESLTRTIRKHMSEFVANYNAYQETMRHETSFALDWHENWLFATNSRKCMPLKRAHQLSELSPILGPSSITATMSSTEDSPDQQQQEQQRLQMKRAKLMQSSSSSSALETNELLNYSTLLINKYKPVKVTFIDGIISTEEPSSFSNSRTKYEQQIDVCYEQEPDYLSELQQTSLELSGQVNVCHLLLNDLCDGPTVGDDMEHCAKRAKRSLEIEYESSLNGGRSLIDGQLLCFRAHGHLFELRKLRHFKSLSSSVEHKQKLNLLKKVILDRLCSACHWRPMAMAKPNNYSEASEAKLAYITRELPFEQYQQDQVRFLVPISDVQVSQALPVIQFCAKVAGALPIRVSWYRLLEDGSKQELSAESFKQSRTRASTTTNQDEWPVTMRANYELEYRNDWLSWYRFKREQGDILFEIRGAHLERDYGQTFECVIENYCSIKECTFKFELKRREPPPPKRKLINPALRRDANNRAGRVLASRAAATGRTRTREQQRELAAFEQDGSSEFDRVRLNKVEPASENQEAGQALLRTWSQRTLNKRAPLVAMDDHANITANDQANNNNNPSPSSFASTSSSAAHNLQILPGGINCQQPQLQTVGRLSAQAMNDCKFGTNYPYHPVSLMRRLEENKMSLTLRSRLRLASKRQIDDQRKVGGGGGRANTSDLSVGTVWDDDENANNNNNNKALESTCSPATGEKHNHDEQQANQEPRLSELEFSSPFAGTPNQSNRPEVRDCGNLDDASFRQTATFMRPSHRQLISNTTHNSEDKHSTSVLLLSDEPGNQDNAADGKDQQKSMDEDCERERIECQPMDHALKPMPRPRQKPMSLVAAAAISSRRLETEVGDDKPNPLFTRRQQPSTDDQHALAKSRSSDLPSSASASNDNDDNYPSSNYRQQSTHALNNSAHVPSIDLTTSRNTTQTPCQSSVDGDDLQTHHASQPTSTVKSRTTISTDATSNSRSESDARPKSVRSLISRFNTGCPSE